MLRGYDLAGNSWVAILKAGASRGAIGDNGLAVISNGHKHKTNRH